MLANPRPPRIHLPKGWQGGVKLAVLHAIALAHYARMVQEMERALSSLSAANQQFSMRM